MSSCTTRRCWGATRLAKLANAAGFWAAARHGMSQGLDFEQSYWLIFGRAPKQWRCK